ncbi:hypothetical protein PCL_11163 [Purpureocillium lilacinum]|uniref:Uncharacterized protein n=1 Tax=Purpureocillium lilacinum TaxID=33203 RepID=A0A2U3EDK8_PURLI|nr:hypothetical protein PCL_11163 [Purpureocillium lilacinum]
MQQLKPRGGHAWVQGQPGRAPALKELPGQLDSLGYLAFHDGNSTQSPPLGARASSNITPVIVIVVVAVNDSLLLLLPARPPSSHRRRLSRALSTPAVRCSVSQSLSCTCCHLLAPPLHPPSHPKPSVHPLTPSIGPPSPVYRSSSVSVRPETLLSNLGPRFARRDAAVVAIAGHLPVLSCPVCASDWRQSSLQGPPQRCAVTDYDDDVRRATTTRTGGPSPCVGWRYLPLHPPSTALLRARHTLRRRTTSVTATVRSQSPIPPPSLPCRPEQARGG